MRVRSQVEKDCNAERLAEADRIEKLIDASIDKGWAPGILSISCYVPNAVDALVMLELNRRFNPGGFRLEYKYYSDYRESSSWIEISAL